MLTISCETITNQIDYSNKNHSNVDEIHVRDIDEDETKNVYNDLQIDVDARDERIIYVDDDQETQKRCHQNVSIYIKSIIQIATKVYKTIATKTLKMKLHVFSIDLHMKKRMIKIMIRMNFETSRNAIEKTINRIQRDLRDKKKTTREIEKNICNDDENLIEKKVEKERYNTHSIIHDIFISLFAQSHDKQQR